MEDEKRYRTIREETFDMFILDDKAKVVVTLFVKTGNFYSHDIFRDNVLITEIKITYKGETKVVMPKMRLDLPKNFYNDAKGYFISDFAFSVFSMNSRKP